MYCITVKRGVRGIFCKKTGAVPVKETEFTNQEIKLALGAFFLPLQPETMQISIAELKEYTTFQPLAEYGGRWGIGLK